VSTFTLAYRRQDMEATVELEFDHATHDWPEVLNRVSAQQFPGVAFKTPLWLDQRLAARSKEATCKPPSSTP
jgi:hypothetical protein